ncbi:hypothetical protein ABW636_20355 [Aquimarina sp. 2201CG1-2-11]|uniref:hypothetical protein n=1 Tax=Aquimarina discodermiae TaxID=3231043 RepID=UPI0034633814
MKTQDKRTSKQNSLDMFSSLLITNPISIYGSESSCDFELSRETDTKGRPS